MYSIADVKAEINAVILDSIKARADIIVPEWVTQVVMSNHPAEDIDDFYLVCSRAQVRKIVGEAMRDMKKTEEEGDASQLHLDGFECLQAFYMIEMPDKELRAIRTDLCSDDQLFAKAEAIGRVSEKLAKHKAEILRYIEDRRNGLSEAS